MVGPGEVDEELEPETAEECSKYGKVIKCVIYEVKKYVTFILGTLNCVLCTGICSFRNIAYIIMSYYW